MKHDEIAAWINERIRMKKLTTWINDDHYYTRFENGDVYDWERSHNKDARSTYTVTIKINGTVADVATYKSEDFRSIRIA